MRQAFRRVPVAPQAQAQLRSYQFPAPSAGWVTNQNLAQGKLGSALVLDNWFPISRGIRAMGGSLKYATVANSAPVYSLFTYVGSASEKFFAADETNIFDISSISDETTIPSADVTGQTSGLYSTAQMVTAAGSYLYAVNGSDKAQLYDGTSWTQIDGASTPAITGITTDKLIFVWPFAQRLFFIEKGTLSAWYLPVNSIGGAAGELALQGVFQKGGSLLFGGSWSLDSGSGLDDKCVFVTDQGEVAVYEGTDPSSADAWQKVGVYQISQPLGKNASMRAGGDLLVAAEDGVVPLSEAIRKDIAALSLAAISRPIEPDWKDIVAERRGLPWEVLKWSANNMMVVSQPRSSDNQLAQALICNLETGAWCRRTGWDTRCLGLYNRQGYFGTNDGLVMQMDVGGNDNGLPYTCTYVGQFDHLKSPGYEKTVMQGRMTFRSTADFKAQLSISTDYAISVPTPPNSIADYVVDEWDVGKWDEAKWDAATAYSVFAEWASIGETGYAVAPVVQATFGITPKPGLELVAIDMTYLQGGLVV